MSDFLPRSCIFVPSFLTVIETDEKVSIAVSEDCPIARLRGQTFDREGGDEPWRWAHEAVNSLKATMTAEDPEWEVGTGSQVADVRLPFYTIYAVDRHYGGPEEGGWWYDTFERVETIAMLPTDSPEVVEARATALWNRHIEKKYGDIGSVLGGLDLRMYAEEVPGEHEMMERPRYE